MAQSNINCSKSTYIRPNDNVTHLGSTVKTSGLIGNNYDVNQVSTAVLQFEIPAALRYKSFVSAKLVCYISPPLNSASAFGAGCWIAPYMCGDVLATLTYANRNAGGIVGESIQVEKLDVYAPATAGWRTFDVSPIFAGNIYNNALFTCFVNACPGQPFLNYEATIDGAGSARVPYLVVTYEDVPQLPPTPAYPANVYLNEGEDVLFSWNFNSTTTAVQTAARLEYKLTSAATYTGVDLTQTGHSYTLVGGLSQGAYDWRVKVTNDAGEVSAFSEVAHFNVIGKPSAPVLATPENKALVTFRWNAADQNAFEITLADSNGNEIINDQKSTGDSFYALNMFLSNGSYQFGVRVKNTTGLWSNWAYKAFSINAAGPAKPNMRIRVDGSKVILDFDRVDNVSYAVMRAEPGEELVCIGVCDALQGSYTDDTAKNGVEYTYTLRAYTNGYTDSDRKSVCCHFEGMILKSGGYEINLTKSDQEFLPYEENITRVTSVLNFSGREFPMIERGEFTTQQIERSFYVTDIERKMLSKMLKLNKAYYRDSAGNAFDCALVSVTFRGWKSVGYIAQIGIVRTEKTEVLLNV